MAAYRCRSFRPGSMATDHMIEIYERVGDREFMFVEVEDIVESARRMYSLLRAGWLEHVGFAGARGHTHVYVISEKILAKARNYVLQRDTAAEEAMV